MLTFLSLKRKPFLALSFHKLKLIRIMFFCFFVGLIYGILITCLNFDDVGLKCCELIKSFLKARLAQSFFLTCIYSFLSYFVPVLFIFTLGFFPVSQPVFFVVPIFYGLGFGLTISSLIVFKGFEGFFIILLEVFPFALISIFVLVLSCKEGFRFANRTFKRVFLKKKAAKLSYGEEVKAYGFKFAALFCFQLIASVLDGFCNFVFVKI